ncbi:sacsin N-terminal ATP-binding-like domain-containing protein [Bradyrhizobium sp. SZCCHNRI20481]|uniref:sacsin N-terminal ATP-binding-like domain-containing protein n=1 Tax=Bradyrhizobium sp. SZCCHNRI20481 TaxID=3057286 RepID=UPI0029164008|nr:hypothetical protein [Bradyrhizobium sp. SZCCHNRI20481]
MNKSSDFGIDLVARLEETVNEKVYKAIALRVRTKVLGARSDLDNSSRRWPFELIQNAHDAGARAGREAISLSFDLTGGVLRFEHDAAPFTMDEFAALLTGGSSKDFMSTETTGRFGTGFLVTHVLSERVHVSGILDVDGNFRGFEVELDRPNDEGMLLQNVQDSQASLRHTRAVAALDGEPTASFAYVVDDERTAEDGLRALEDALPFLFATCRRLGEITIRRGDAEVHWKLTSSSKPNLFSTKPSEYYVSRTGNDGRTDWRVIRATETRSSTGAMVVALIKEGAGWSVRKPLTLPSVFRQLPLLGSPVLPGWTVIDGLFDVEQERRTIYISGEQARPLREAFAALPALMALANTENWTNGYRIAQLGLPPGIAGETAIGVWTEILSTTAQKLSMLPLIRTAKGGKVRCANHTDDARYADFIRRPQTGPSYDDLWELAACCTEADPPDRAVSEGWSEIVEGWETLGVKVSWIDLETIGERACEDVEKLEDLKVETDPTDWLTRYLDAVGKTWKLNGITKSYVDGLVPDQHGILRNADELKFDGGVSGRTKEISAGIGLDLESQLLDERLVESLASQNLAAGLFTLREITKGELAEDEAIEGMLHRLSTSLPDDQKVAEEKKADVDASIDLLAHLWAAGGKALENAAWKVPLLARDGAAYKPRRRRTMMLPASVWPESARGFLSAYPPGRVLDERYAERGQDLIEALSSWGVAYSGLLTSVDREEISERGLRPLAAVPDQVAGVTLRDASLSQIALLEPELIQYCKTTREKAKALLGLVVCFVAAADASWRCSVEFPVKTADGQKNISLTPSLWLSDLRSKPWIPIEQDDEVVHHPATTALVRDLLDPEWLQGNSYGAELLVRHFGLDALDVRLLAAAADETVRQQLRDSLARIVEVVGGNTQVIEELAMKARQHHQGVNLMRKLGLAVQQCVLEALESRGLKVDPDDYGYDFLVTANDDPDDLSSQFQIAQYKLEVKTTTTGEPRLTPLQASTCAQEPDTFVLCVVDLRDFAGDVHAIEWSSDIVSPLCRLLPGSAIPISETLSFVEGAAESDVPIRNASSLRYGVTADLWEAGLDFDNWVEAAFGSDAESTAIHRAV